MLKARILTALVLIPLFLWAVFYLPDSLWIALTLALTLIGCHEWTRICRFDVRETSLYLIASMCLCILMLWLIDRESLEISDLYIVSALFWIVAAPFWLANGWEISHPGIMSVVGWILLLPTWLSLIDIRVQGVFYLLSIMAVIWVADTAAYFAGRAFGKRKLAPAISPGKSWEGVIGAFLGVTVYGGALSFFGDMPIEFYWLIPAFWLLTAFSIMGDLFESMMKRQAGLKDSGTLLPGHGGILDRIDSLTATLPLAALALSASLYIFS